jgi:hypothetical protein
MAFKYDPISTVLASVKAILTFSIFFLSMSLFLTVLDGRIGIRTGLDRIRIRIWPSKTFKNRLVDKNKILEESMAFTLAKTVEIGSYLKAYI